MRHGWNTSAVRVLLVVNPSATHVTPERRAEVERVLSTDHDLKVVETCARDHATELARTGVAEGVECVVVLAGDGTLNEVLPAVADSDCILAALPGGSTNVYCRTIGLPDDLSAATALVDLALTRGATRRSGLGSVNGRHFLLHAGIGWDAELVSIVERHLSLKRRFGHLLFIYAGLRAFFGTYDRTGPHFTVEVEPSPGSGRTAQVIEDGYFAVALNSDPYTFVHTRPFVVRPNSTFDTALSLVVARSMKVRHFLPLPVRALSGRRGLRAGRHVEVLDDLTSFTVHRITEPDERTMPYQVDGDHLGQADELVFRHHPDCITLLAP